MKRQIGLNSWRTHIKTGFWFHEHLNMANEQVNVSQGFDVIWIWFCLYQYQEITSFISFYSWGTEFLLKYFQSLPGRLINAILKDSLLERIPQKNFIFTRKWKTNQKIRMRHTTELLSTETLKVLLKPGGREASSCSYGWSTTCILHVTRVNQNGFSSTCLKNLKQFDTLKSSTEWTGLEVREAGFRHVLRIAVTCRRHPGGAGSDQRTGAAAVRGHFTPKAGCILWGK